MSASTAEISTKQISYIKCTNTVARLNVGRGLRGVNMFMRSSNIEVFIPGIIEACKHFTVGF